MLYALFVHDIGALLYHSSHHPDQVIESEGVRPAFGFSPSTLENDHDPTGRQINILLRYQVIGAKDLWPTLSSTGISGSEYRYKEVRSILRLYCKGDDKS
jgi:hypothetical protein